MALDDDIALLAAAPVFGFLDRDALRLLTFAGERRTLAPGDVLFRRGAASDGGYVVLAGTIALAAREAGAPPILAGPAALIGRAALFVPGERPTTATARTVAALLRVSPALMRRVLVEFPNAHRAIRDSLAGDLDDLIGGLARVRRRLDALTDPDDPT